MSGGGGTNTVQKADPWSGAQPHLLALFDAANKNTQTQRQFYPNETVAPWSGTTLTANSKIYDRAISGNPLLGESQGQASDTLQGKYLTNPTTGALLDIGTGNFGSNPALKTLGDTASGAFLNSNPYLDSMFDRASSSVGRNFSQNVLPGVASMFSGAGRYGSNQMTNAVDQVSQNYGRTIDDLATQIYGDNYARERQLQQNASGTLGTLGLGALNTAGDQFGRERTIMGLTSSQAPGLAAADYNDLSKLEGLGLKEEQNQQARIDEAIKRWDFGQNEMYNRLAEYSQLINGTANFGGGTKSTSASGDPLMQALGYGMLGSSLYSNLGGASLFGAGDAAASAALLDGLAGVGTGVAGMTYADALAAGLIAL